MALIKCIECGKDVSDKAPSCPNCGNPIKINNPIQIEPVLVSKKWKKAKLFSWGGIVLGLFIISLSGDSFQSDNPIFWMGFAFIGYGIISLMISKIGAWYADRRER